MKNGRMPCAWVAIGYLFTVIIWVIIGKISWNYLHPDIFRETFSWFIIWNIITAFVNSCLFLLAIHLSNKYEK